MSKKNSESFCIAPWIQAHIDSCGMMCACCASSHHSAANNILDDGSVFTINKDDLKSALNSKSLKDLRGRFLEGEFPEQCERCWADEAIGIDSYRKNLNRKYRAEVQDILKSGSIEAYRLSSFDIQVGNQCNLRCRMCAPASSINLLQEHRKLSLSPNIENTDWPLDKLSWKNLSQVVEGLNFLKLWGGEPLLSSHALDFLKQCTSLGYSKKIDLFINTNMLPINKEILDITSSFKTVNFSCSIDGYSVVNDYIRYPSNWSAVVEKLDLLKNYVEAGRGNIRVSFTTTLQIYNLLGLKDLCDFLLQRYDSPNINVEPDINMVYNPPYFNIGILPRHVKRRAIELLNSIQHSSHSQQSREKFRSDIESIKNYLSTSQENPQLMQKFREITDFFDDSRGQCFKNALPDLAQMLKL